MRTFVFTLFTLLLLLTACTHPPIEKPFHAMLPEVQVFAMPMGAVQKEQPHLWGLALHAFGTHYVFIESIKVDGKIAVNTRVLGHEIMHHLDWLYPGVFWNPDEYEWYR